MKNVYFILFLVTALVFSGWAVSPALSSSAPRPELTTSECRIGVEALVGELEALPGVVERANRICGFNVRMNELDEEISNLDRRFIESAIAGNTLEIQSLQYAREHVENEEWRGLIDMMIAMHTHDLELAIAVAEKYNLDTTPDLTDARVYPRTPDYNLGMRRVDLVAKFLNPLMSAGPTSTPTAVPTDLTGTPTTSPTMVTTGTVDLTGTATAAPPEETVTPSTTLVVDLTGTATPTPAEDTVTPSTTLVVDLTGTATSTPPEETVTPSATLPVDLTGTATVEATGTITITPSAVPTIPTIPGGATENFDLVSLLIIEDEHVMSVETALAAQRLVQNEEIRAFARHAADMAQLHLILINNLQYRMLGLEVLPPPPDFQREYQGPRRNNGIRINE
jgi:hypothetical protein